MKLWQITDKFERTLVLSTFGNSCLIININNHNVLS